MKNSRISARFLAGSLVVLSACLSTLMVATQPTLAIAQQRGPVQRVVQGKVTDKSEEPLKGAIVYLKDTHSLAVKSSIADETGAYRFGQLASNVDYELWAESNGKKSGTKTISSFDSKSQFYINLKVDAGK